nr:class I SAM-dependent DNA methyltransferase [Sphingopyxis macrogoltabida]
MSNYQLFVERLTGALGVPQPAFAREDTRQNDYVFERNVTFHHPNGTTSSGRIDCYKRGHFILEAKQSAKRQSQRDRDMQEQLTLAGIETTQKMGHAKRGTRGWDKIMIAAKKQAEDYARALPVDHGYPPFLLIVDVGNVIEIFADFSGQGKNYAHFPDRQNYRLSMDDLLDPDIQQRLIQIWTNPQALDPTKISAEVTQDIAERLAKIAKRLEGRHAASEIAEFLMRCLFTMFAEDVDLLPKKPGEEEKPFEAMLRRMTPDIFPHALESLWKNMDVGGFDGGLERKLKKFNGSLFKKTKALKLDEDDIRELWLASRRNWKDVEPAIFGTLLERALDPKERSKLGAHYTPRPYVERLVIPTIIEPLRADWEEVLARVEDLQSQGERKQALQVVRDFHHRLCTTRVLDPACGTGNFLYVSLELMKRLEGEILETLDDLGEDEAKLLLDGETVSPKQFFGLEINERAVPIADLVLWIGFLKWQLRTVAAKDVPEPILNAYGTIRHQDALIAYDEKRLARDEQGKPVTIWDGVTKKLHPITGEEVPDENARRETYLYVNPRRAVWPDAEFIVGNPPFIGGKDMRAELGDGYAEACWAVRRDVPGGADFVMHFWDEAARHLTAKPAKGKANPLRRFGFITTNSITQTFSRRVVEKYMGAKEPLSLIYAVPDHPWMKASDKAAVRIAMTVAVRGEREGVLAAVASEAGLNTDTPKVELKRGSGKVTAKLSLGADVSKAVPLMANDMLSSPGVKLHGSGFIVTPREAAVIGLGRQAELDKYILNYRHGRDLAQRARGVMVIDLFGLKSEQVRDRYPEVYQRIVDRVKPERDQNARDTYRNNWWIFGEPRSELRKVLNGQDRYIATIETAKHRFFQFLRSDVRPDNMLIAMGLDNAAQLAVLSARSNVVWAINTGGWMGVGNDSRYSKTRTFDPYPFPAESPPDLKALGERLDAFRKERLSKHDHLTMTGLYNVLERVRELDNGAPVDPLTPAERDIYDAGRIAILKELHDDIDRAVFAAYGWDDLAARLVGKPGATTPSPHKSEDQEAAEDELLMRLVALNQERAADEKRGIVHWLRPDFQIPRLGHKVHGHQQHEADLGEPVAAATEVKWPADGLDQIRSVRDMLAAANGPVRPDALSAAFSGRSTPKRRERIQAVLETLVATGSARAGDAGYYLPR